MKPLLCPACLEDLLLPGALKLYQDGTVRDAPLETTIFGGKRALDGDSVDSIEDLQDPRKYHCVRGHELPHDLRKVGVEPIGLVGFSSSMKTHYIAVTTRQLVHDQRLYPIDAHRSLTFVPQNKSSQERLKDLQRRLFQDKKAIGSTLAVEGQEPVRDPITLTAKFKQVYVPQTKRTRYVALFDAPGEKFEDEDELMKYAPYLAHSSGIILFVDAGSILEVREALGEAAPSRFTEINPVLISRLADNIGALPSTKKRRGKLEIPLAVVISRADLLQDRDEFAKYSQALGRDFAGPEARELARQFVEEYERGVSIFCDQSFERVSYFFASATGCAVDDDDNFESIKPWGCLDPLLWLLEEVGLAR